MNQIAVLRRIPPAEILHLHPERRERAKGLLDLDLQPAVGEDERIVVIDEDFQNGSHH